MLLEMARVSFRGIREVVESRIITKQLEVIHEDLIKPIVVVHPRSTGQGGSSNVHAWATPIGWMT